MALMNYILKASVSIDHTFLVGTEGKEILCLREDDSF
jgi:hypothetical protein